jgi:hypothetical protein
LSGPLLICLTSWGFSHSVGRASGGQGIIML